MRARRIRGHESVKRIIRRKMKKFWQGLAFAAMIMLQAGATAPVMAAETHVTSGENNVRIVRSVTNVVNPVAVTFSYSMTADENNPAEIGGLANFSMRVSATPNGGIAQSDKIVNLSDLTFTKVGDYRIVIREIASSDERNYPIDDMQAYTVLIAVRNELDGTRPTGNLIASVADQVTDAGGRKTDNLMFDSMACRTHIQLTKAVSGDNADTDEYFKFRIDFPTARLGDVFSITGQDTVVEYGGQSIQTQRYYTVGEENFVYLKHGQSVQIGNNGENELPLGLEYSITELDADSYSTYVDGDMSVSTKQSRAKQTASEYGGNPSGMSFSAENVTSFDNMRNGSVATGVSTMVLPFVGIAIIGIAGVCVYWAISKKKN